MHPILALVSEGIAKSKALIEDAAAEKWDEFYALEAERQTLIRSINLENIILSESDNEQLHELMTKLIALNEQIESICVQQRDNAAGKLQDIRKGNKVSKAYSQ